MPAAPRELRTPDSRLVVVTTLTDNEAAAALRRNEQSQFARSLIASREKWGRWTDSQLAWAHQLANEQLAREGMAPWQTSPATAAQHPNAPAPPSRPSPVSLGDFAPISALFTTAAASGLKYPKIRFDARDDVPALHLSRAGERSKYPGSIAVTSPGDFDNRHYYGRIGTNGVFYPAADCPADVADFLRRFAADPAGVAAEYGRRSGRCCFCARKLDDPRSVAVGVGPVCCKKFGIRFPTTKEVKSSP